MAFNGKDIEIKVDGENFQKLLWRKPPKKELDNMAEHPLSFSGKDKYPIDEILLDLSNFEGDLEVEEVKGVLLFASEHICLLQERLESDQEELNSLEKTGAFTREERSGQQCTEGYFEKIDKRFEVAKRYDTVVTYKQLGFNSFSESVYHLSKEHQFKKIAKILKTNPNIIGIVGKIMGVSPGNRYIRNPKNFSETDSSLLYSEDIYNSLCLGLPEILPQITKEFKPCFKTENIRTVGTRILYASEALEYLYGVEKMSLREISNHAKCSTSTIRRTLKHLIGFPMRGKGGANFKGRKMGRDL